MPVIDRPTPTQTVDGEPVLEFLRRHLAGDFLLWSPNIQGEAFLNWDRIWASRTIPSLRSGPTWSTNTPAIPRWIWRTTRKS